MSSPPPDDPEDMGTPSPPPDDPEDTETEDGTYWQISQPRDRQSGDDGTPQDPEVLSEASFDVDATISAALTGTSDPKTATPKSRTATPDLPRLLSTGKNKANDELQDHDTGKNNDDLQGHDVSEDDDSLFVSQDCEASDEDDGLFVAQDHPARDDAHKSETGVGPPHKAHCKESSDTRSRKKTGPRAKTAREVREKKRERAASKSMSKKTGNNVSKKNSGLGKKQRGKRPVKKADGRRRGKAGSGKHVSKLVTTLLDNDLIQQRREQGEHDAAPSVDGRQVKTQMLKNLLASIPDNVNKRQMGIERQDILKASKSFGAGKVQAIGSQWKLKGMESSLYHHQLLGVKFMVDRELDDQLPHGGLLADSMGLGKTLEVIATIVGNQPDPALNQGKTTLVVVPPGAVKQWEQEINKHVTPNLFKRILHYKRTKEISLESLKDHDIISKISLTSGIRRATLKQLGTSYELLGSYDKLSVSQQGGISIDRAEWFAEHWEDRGNLHRMMFYRVVLDEAHAIRNHRSRTSMSCIALKATYRWAISGTPIQNRLEELYPYFRFLRVPYIKDLVQFRDEYCNPEDEDCMRRVGVMLSFVMMRRTHRDLLLGRPLVTLPKAHNELTKLEFTQDERALYEVLEEKFRTNINAYFKQGTARKHYGHIFVMLLRLRQATSHPFLLQPFIKDGFSLEDLRRLEDRIGQATDRRPFYEQIGVWVNERMQQEPEPSSAAANEKAPGSPEAFGRSNFGQKFDMTKYLATLNEEEMLARCICHICGDLAAEPQITDCQHVFCKECIRTACETSAMAGYDSTQCPTCHQVFTATVPYNNLTPHQAQSSSESLSDVNGTQNSQEHQAKKSGDSWLELTQEMLPSTKLVAVKAKILEWLREAPDDKIIVFTQFNLTARILRRICELEQWPSVQFLGDRGIKSRQSAFDKFTNDPDIKIMIAGIKCGGQALNLTVANRVIIVDLWWNHGLEQQAFGRVFRIGQTKETYLVRYAIKGTVDDRMLAMQDFKLEVVGNAMADNGRYQRKLTVEELASLFGYLTEDEDGNPMVVPDNAMDLDNEDQDDEEGGQHHGEKEVVDPDNPYGEGPSNAAQHGPSSSGVNEEMEIEEE